jgi:hypothetical protein
MMVGHQPSALPHVCDDSRMRYDVLLCRQDKASPMMGILGEALDDRSRVVALDLAYMNCICLFGEPGAGKSYCLGAIIEMAVTSCHGINLLPRPCATVVFHYSQSVYYRPEFASAIQANDQAQQLQLLRERYHAAPEGISDCYLLAPRDVVAERQREFPGIEVRALTFAARELQASHWRILMGAMGEEDSLYLQVMNQILKRHRGGITIAKIAADISASALDRHDQDRARVRLALAEQYIDDGVEVSSYLRSGRLLLIDLRDEFLQKKEALSLLLVLLQLFADRSDAGRPLQKFCVFDEAHKYLRDPALIDCLTETIREMRHKSTTILIASQDPPSVPLPMIELSSMVLMLKMTSPLWLNHVAAVKPAYAQLAAADLANLDAGEAYVWAKTASDREYARTPHRLRIRPRFTKHGGDTKITLALPC